MKPIAPIPPRRSTDVHPQRGVALVVALILLVIMTLVGLSAMRTVTLEEKMTGHTFDRSLSFQSTESALREAEAIVQATIPTPAPLSGCVNGICSTPVSTATPRWRDSSFTGWQSGTAVASGPLTITPQYIIEYLGNTFPCALGSGAATNCKRYRITARSNAGNDRAVVVLQTVYGTD